MTAITTDPFTGEPLRPAAPSPDAEQAVRNAVDALSPLARRALGHAAAHHGEMLWLAAFAADAGANPVDALAAVEELVSTVAVHEAPGNIGRVQWLAKDVTRALDPGTGATAGVVVMIGPWTEEAPAVAAELGVRPYDHAAAARWWGRADGEDAR